MKVSESYTMKYDTATALEELAQIKAEISERECADKEASVCPPCV